MENKPIFNVGTKTRPLSWSCIASWEYNKEQWYRKYVLNEVQQSNQLMDFGKVVGERLASDPTFLPEVPRYKHFEKKLEGKIGDIYIIGYFDSFCPDTKHFREYKTSSNVKKWNKKTAQDHGQMAFYRLLIWLNYMKRPEEVNGSLHYIPVEETNDFSMKLSTSPVQHFETKHSTLDILNFGKYLQQTYKDMVKYVEERGTLISPAD